MLQKLIVLGICAFMIVGCGDENSTGSSSPQDRYEPQYQKESPTPSPESSPQPQPTIDPFYGDRHGKDIGH